MIKTTDVIIVGAGLAGLRAATILNSSGISTIVVERLNRVGGKILTVQIGSNSYDQGGQWIGKTQRHIWKITQEELKLQLIPQFDHGKAILDLAGIVTEYDGTLTHIESYGPNALRELGFVVRSLDALALGLNQDTIYQDDMSVNEWMTENVKSELVKRLLSTAIETILGTSSFEQMSLLNLLWLLKCSPGGYRSLMLTQGGAQEFTIQGGAQQIATMWANSLITTRNSNEGATFSLMLNKEVVSICQEEAASHPVVVSVRDLSKTGQEEQEVIRARYGICTIPLEQLHRVHFDPPLPTPQLLFSKHVIPCAIIKCVLTYSHPFWRDKGLSGETMSDSFPIRFTFEHSPASLLCFVTGGNALQLGQMNSTDRKEAVITHACRLFGIEAKDYLQSYLEKDWSHDEASGKENEGPGGYFGFMKKGAAKESCCHWGTWSSTPHNRVHWAGTETATEWFGYMDGAIQSGIRASNKVLKLLKQNQLDN